MKEIPNFTNKVNCRLVYSYSGLPGPCQIPGIPVRITKMNRMPEHPGSLFNIAIIASIARTENSTMHRTPNSLSLLSLMEVYATLGRMTVEVRQRGR